MNVDMVNSFVAAAREVLRLELDEEIGRGKIRLTKSSDTSDEVTAMIAVTGQVRGLVLYTMSTATACELAGAMIGQPCEELDALGESAIAELANMITGRASVFLEANAVTADVSPPALILGRGSCISTVDLARLVVPLETRCGPLAIHLALRGAA